MGSPDWLSCIDPEENADVATVAGNGKMMRILALSSLALLFVVARPISITEWRIRDYLDNKRMTILTGIFFLVWCIISLYLVYLLYEGGWFNTWRRNGFFKMVGNIFWMLLWFFMQLAVLNITVTGLAGMKQQLYNYFDNGMTSLATFVATWIILIVGKWRYSL